MAITIEAQIYTAFDTGRKMANDKPDLIFISFAKVEKRLVCNFHKVFNNDTVPFFSLIVPDKEKLSELISIFLLSEKTRFRFAETTNVCFKEIETNVRKAFFEDWLRNKTQNIYQRDEVRMKMALEKIK